MARIVTQGNAAIFTTQAAISDGTDKQIGYQWQVSGVDLVDGASIPTKSDIGSFFFSPVVDSLGAGYRSCNNNCGAGTVGTKTAIASGTSVLGGGLGNSVRFSVPDQIENYFAEFEVGGQSLAGGIGWFGVLDPEHWDGGTSNITTNGAYQKWNGDIGVRMAPWFSQPYGFGERTDTKSFPGAGQSLASFEYFVGDIIGVVVNTGSGAVNFYKNGSFLGTFRNRNAIGKYLHVFLQNQSSSTLINLECTALTTASSYATNYYFPSEGLQQDPSIGLSGQTVTVSGAKTRNLTITSGQVNTYDLRCQITHPRAHNSPITTNAVELEVVDSADKNFLNFEYYPRNNGTQATLETVDLQDSSGSGPFYTIDRNIDFSNIVFYAPDKDVNVELEMFGPRGLSQTGGGAAGKGGYSVIRFTAEQFVEYAIAGSAIGQFFVYKQNRLLAVVGSGGNGSSGAFDGNLGNGGDGGGVTDAGSDAAGFNALSSARGLGGQYIPPGQLGQNGISGSSINQPIDIEPRASAPDGGRANEYPIGIYWAQQGFSPSENMGQVQFRHANGTIVNNSNTHVDRGYKPGTGGYRANAGAGAAWIGPTANINGTFAVTDTQGTIDIENDTGIKITVQRYNDGVTGTEGHANGSIGYIVEVNVNNLNLRNLAVGARVRGSGAIAADGSIQLAPGYPERIDARTFRVSYSMTNSQGSGLQSTYARNFTLGFTGLTNSGNADGGFGATGGQGGIGNQGAGGGGSGYHSDDATVLTSVVGGSELDTARLVFKTFNPIRTGSATHFFGGGRTTSITFGDALLDVDPQSPGAPNGWSGAAGNLNAKHYLIRVNNNYSSLNITNFAGWTAGGGQFDSNMSVGEIQKVNSSQWRIWFNRGSGFNTYVRNFSVEGIL